MIICQLIVHLLVIAQNNKLVNLRIKTYFRSINFSTPRKDNPKALLTAYYYTAVEINIVCQMLERCTMNTRFTDSVTAVPMAGGTPAACNALSAWHQLP